MCPSTHIVPVVARAIATPTPANAMHAVAAASTITCVATPVVRSTKRHRYDRCGCAVDAHDAVLDDAAADADVDVDVGAIAVAVARARARKGMDARATSRWARMRAKGVVGFMRARVSRWARAVRGRRVRTGRE